MDKRILIGMTFVVLLCAGVWWFVSPESAPKSASVQPTNAPSQENVPASPAELASTELAPSRSETQRSVVVAPTPITATATPDTALVKLLVLDKSTRKPMPGVKVLSSYEQKGATTWGEDHGLSRGKPWDTLRTDADGRAEIEAPAHTELYVSASAERADAGGASKTVGPLESKQTAEIVLEIPTGIDMPYWMKIVDETTRAPLVGATVNVAGREQGDNNLTCDAQGFVFVPARSWSRPRLQAHAKDHAELCLEPERGHERIEDAFVVALPKTATLRAHVVDGTGASIAAARVVLTMHGYQLEYSHDMFSDSFDSLPDPRWEGETDASGIATIAGIPPRLPIKASIDRPKQWTCAQDLTLEPGETRDVEWKLTSGCQVQGVLLDQTNSPVIARQMWLRKAERNTPAYFEVYSSGETRATVSDQQGRFQFEAVSPGAWWIGPSSHDRDQRAAPDDVAPLAQVVNVVDGQNVIDLTLHVDRGLLISGKVLDANGAPADTAWVSAYDQTAHGYMSATTRDAGGEFVLGPLMAGRFLLRVHGHGSNADSLPVEVEAGTRDVVLQLRQGVAIAGTVVDESGQLIPAIVCVSQRDSKTFGMHMMSPRQDGSFRLDGLVPGTYQVSAHTSDGHIGVFEDVEASATESSAHVVVKLRPGGHVRARHEGPEKHASIGLFQNGVELAGDGVALGETKEMVAPVGSVVVRMDYYEADRRTAERTVEVKAGETVDVVFEKGAQ